MAVRYQTSKTLRVHHQTRPEAIALRLKLEVVRISGDAPIQGFGYLNSHPWYFRARGDQWEFAVANEPELGFDQAIAATMHRGNGLLLSKRYRNTTEMTEEKARAIIWRAARAAVAFLE